MKKKSPHRFSSQLPIDIRLVPDIFAFSHVHGAARVFLTVEIILSVLVVCGTLFTVLLSVFGI